jgi:hypothetical protein
MQQRHARMIRRPIYCLIAAGLIGVSGAKDLRLLFDAERDLVSRSNEAEPAVASGLPAAKKLVEKALEQVTSHPALTVDTVADKADAVHLKLEVLGQPSLSASVDSAADEADAVHLKLSLVPAATAAKKPVATVAEKAAASAVVAPKEAAPKAAVAAASSWTPDASADWADSDDTPSWEKKASSSSSSSSSGTTAFSSASGKPKLQVKFTNATGVQPHLLIAAKANAEQAMHFMAQKASWSPSVVGTDQCSCEFKGMCLCENAIEFMDCVAAKCNSGGCDCHEEQFIHACTSIADVCLQDPEAGVLGIEMQCTIDRATCLMEEDALLYNKRDKDTVYEELKDLKEKKCRLEMAAEDGWINAATQLSSVNSEIDSRFKELDRLAAAYPEMHCEKHFEEWHDEHLQQPEVKQSGAVRAALAAAATVAVAAVTFA